MKKIIVIVIVLLAIGIGVYYIIAYKISNGILSSNQIPAASGVAINIKDFSFNPPEITIKAGTKVIWVNNDGAPHTVTSDSGNLLDSPTLSRGQSFNFIFNEAGTVNYHCGIHPMMKGKIIVTKN